MVKKYPLLSILLLLLFSSIKAIAIEKLNFPSESNSITIRWDKTQAFEVYFEDITKINNYMKIEVFSEDDNPAPLLCFSTSDANCVSRNQIAKNASGKNAIIWLKREEFNKDTDNFFIYVQCANGICSYNLTIFSDFRATFGPNFVYSYLVTQYNKEMAFEIKGQEANAYMTIVLEGSSSAIVSDDDIYREGIHYRTGNAFIFFLEDMQDITNESILARIKVKSANVGEYLTLSAHIVNSNEAYEGLASGQNLILPNGPEISGYLEKNIIDSECFSSDLSNSKYNSMNTLYITGSIHTKYARFFLEDENQNYLKETDMEILDGQLSYVMKNNKKMNYICFKLPNESELIQFKMAFTFSITAPNILSNLYNYYPP